MLNTLKLLRSTSENADFQQLISQLDADLSFRNGDFHSFHSQFNKITNINHVVLVYENETAIGCGAIKEYSANTMEVKRMFVHPDKQGKGIATTILKELEIWTAELGYKKCILQTGINQPEAIRLYEKNNYAIIPNFGQYENDKNSVCFEKTLLTASGQI